MANVFDVANFLIDASNSKDEADITNLKLNKLLYFAQACSLVSRNEPLFTDQIRKWDLGPVVPNIYTEYRIYGPNVIPPPQDKCFINRLADDEIDVLINVLLQYGKYSASTLVDISHAKGGPWDITDTNAEISQGIIKSYFSTSKTFRCNDPVKYENIPINTPKKQRDGTILLSREDFDAWN